MATVLASGTVPALSVQVYTFPRRANLRLMPDVGEQAIVKITRGSLTIFSSVLTTEQNFGPFLGGDVLEITAQRGACDFFIIGAGLVQEKLNGAFDSETGRVQAYINPITGVEERFFAAGPVGEAAEVVLRAPLDTALREFGNGPMVPFPTLTPAKAITGATIYVDPRVGGAGAGTFASPYQSLATAVATAASGGAVLIAEGTTCILSASINPPDGIVIGVYNAAYGARVSNKVGAARINCNGGAFVGIGGANKTVGVCVEGLEFINQASGQWCVQFTGTSANCQILRCKATGGLYHFAIQASGANHNIEGNESVNAGDFAILRELLGNDATGTVSFNRLTGAVTHGLFITDSAVGFSFSGRVQCNYGANGGMGNDSAGFVKVFVGGGAPKITHNYGRGGGNGIWVQTGSSAGPLDFSGLVVENNDCSFFQFPILLSRMRGDWVVQYNSFTDAGRRPDDPSTPVRPEAYGRCVEVYGANFASRVLGGTIRWNYAARSKSWFRESNNFPGTEGVGIGLDNECFGVTVYGNYCEDNEGQGLQCNTGSGNTITGNWSVNDACAPVDVVANWPDECRAAIHHSFNPGTVIANNTIVLRGRSGQRHGITELKGTPSLAAQTINNVIIGATGSAITRHVVAGGSTEAGNLAIQCGSLVADAVTETAIAADATTYEGALTDIVMSSRFYPPTVGGEADGTGVAVPPGSISGAGAQLSLNTPRGALHPSVA